jgi:hypothetical protein
VVWVGRRAVDLARHPRPETAAPVRIAAGALGGGLPRRDLRVSPEHGLLLDRVLVPARLLLGLPGVAQDGPWRRLARYVHLELDRHDLLLAEGAPAESWLDCGNRSMFDNGGALVALFPDLAPAAWGWDATRACAPRIEAAGDPRLLAIRARLLRGAAVRPAADDGRAA